MPLTDWLKGSHITTVSVAAVTVAAGGAYTVSVSPKVITAYLNESAGLQGSVDTENVSPVTSVNRNPVPLEVGTAIEIAEIFRGGGAAGTLDHLRSLYYGSTLYVQVVYTRGGVTYTLVGMMTSFSEPVRKGAIGGVLRIESVDIGAANPALS